MYLKVTMVWRFASHSQVKSYCVKQIKQTKKKPCTSQLSPFWGYLACIIVSSHIVHPAMPTWATQQTSKTCIEEQDHTTHRMNTIYTIYRDSYSDLQRSYRFSLLVEFFTCIVVTWHCKGTIKYRTFCCRRQNNRLLVNNTFMYIHLGVSAQGFI